MQLHLQIHRRAAIMAKWLGRIGSRAWRRADRNNGRENNKQANGVLAVTNQLALIECEWVGRVGLEAVGWFGLGGNLYLPRTRAHSGEKHKHALLRLKPIEPDD